ncbi:hypothetical protein ACFL6I_10365 [candidate division KSB1 bacterium]
MEPIAIRIDYWTYPDGSPTGEEPEGIEEFRNDLQDNYVSLVRGQSSACGGGLYELVVQVASSISLRDFANIILGGIAYDLVKSGTHSFVLRPLIAAFMNLKSRNKKQNIEVDELKFSFQDADIIVKKVATKPLFDELERVFKAVAESYEFLKGRNGELPYEIHIPVFEDPDPRFCRYRSLLDVDETIEEVSADSYLHLWGVRYNLEGQIRVFDVQRQILIDDRYMTQEEYLEAWKLEWAKENAIAQQRRSSRR